MDDHVVDSYSGSPQPSSQKQASALDYVTRTPSDLHRDAMFVLSRTLSLYKTRGPQGTIGGPLNRTRCLRGTVGDQRRWSVLVMRLL
ncbi:hypothetical protein RRG08_060239 [Elysia crispata]|uniref:Uncharacterized protein n=1 Tax=Elysia crispata TaxID=231223 RepID=A0AAE0ZVZ3_9GAST|nr:hypothetical protein RRG08_060239 [Elysia crispata]